jgi:hypothetical protein
LAASVFAGVLTFVLYIIGVNVLPVEPTQRTGEIVAFALAALAALIGVSLLPGKEHASADTPPSPPATPPQASPS